MLNCRVFWVSFDKSFFFLFYSSGDILAFGSNELNGIDGEIWSKFVYYFFLHFRKVYQTEIFQLKRKNQCMDILTGKFPAGTIS